MNDSGKKQLELGTKEIIAELSDEEKDSIACSNYHYMKKIKPGIDMNPDRRRQEQEENDSTSIDEIEAAKKDAIEEFIGRFLLNNSHKKEKTLTAIRDCLAFREENKVNESAYAFYCEKDDDYLLERQERCRSFMGKKPRAIVFNYDEEGRANLWLSSRFNFRESREDLEGLLGVYGYMMERAIAATIRNTNGKHNMVNVVLDTYNFKLYDQSMPMSVMNKMLQKLIGHFPERINCIYMVDPPYIARMVWGLVSPLINSYIAKTSKTINGLAERDKEFGANAAHPEIFDKIEIEEYYTAPFEYTWTDYVKSIEQGKVNA